MHEDFLSYIMTGLSRGLTPPIDQRRPFDDEERIIRALARQAAANRPPAPALSDKPRTNGFWRRYGERFSRLRDLIHLPRQGGPSACR